MEPNPYEAPEADLKTDQPRQEFVYVGFWLRVLASIVDTILILLVTMPILISLYGWAYLDSASLMHGWVDFLVSYIFPAIAVIAFWVYRSATPGKIMIGAKVVDADTQKPLTVGKAVLRYVGYYISSIPLLIGIIWVAFDRRKRGWHDYIAGSVVIFDK